MADEALRGTYSDFKLVKTRSVVQVIIEMPITDAKKIVEFMGMPNPAEEQWVALALLKKPGTDEKSITPANTPKTNGPTEKVKTQWHERSPGSQAAYLCTLPEFRAWIATKMTWQCELNNVSCDETAAKNYIYGNFNIKSRSELNAMPDDWAKFMSQYRADTRETAEVRS